MITCALKIGGKSSKYATCIGRVVCNLHSGCISVFFLVNKIGDQCAYYVVGYPLEMCLIGFGKKMCAWDVLLACLKSMAGCRPFVSYCLYW